jgi:hypothetical protein
MLASSDCPQCGSANIETLCFTPIRALKLCVCHTCGQTFSVKGGSGSAAVTVSACGIHQDSGGVGAEAVKSARVE